MATFAELQCFNKLLLDKMNRQEKEIKDLKKETERLKNIQVIYNSLENALQHWGIDEIGQCEDCEQHWGMSDMTFHFDEHYCEYCIEEHNFVMCSFCGDSFDLDRPEEKELIVYDMDGDAYCTCHCCRESYKETMEDHYRQKYNDVMDELIKESNIERHYKILHKQKYRDVITSLPRKCWCGKHIRNLWDCDTCFYDGEKSDTDSDAF